MPSMTPMMSSMRFELSLMSRIVEITCSTMAPPSAAAALAADARSLALRAESEVCATVPVSCSIDAAVSWRLEAACSVRTDRSWLPPAISPEATEIESVTWRTLVTVWRSDAIISPRLCNRLPVGASPTSTARLPDATWLTARAASTGSPPIWPSTLRLIAQPMLPITTRSSTATAMPLSRAERTCRSTSSM